MRAYICRFSKIIKSHSKSDKAQGINGTFVFFHRTGLEYIDLFFIHYMDTQGFFLETWKSMIDLKHQGKIR